MQVLAHVQLYLVCAAHLRWAESTLRPFPHARTCAERSVAQKSWDTFPLTVFARLLLTVNPSAFNFHSLETNSLRGNPVIACGRKPDTRMLKYDKHAAILQRRRGASQRSQVVCQIPDGLQKQINEGRHLLSPVFDGDVIYIRYMYDGGRIAQGHLCRVLPASSEAVTGREILDALLDEGVDLSRFYARVYEHTVSMGGWLTIPDTGDSMRLPLLQSGKADGDAIKACLDVKLCRRNMPSMDEQMASHHKKKDFKNRTGGFFAIGIHGLRKQINAGTLWRSAYQQGATFAFSIGGLHYKRQFSDVLDTFKDLPFLQFETWSAFVENTPSNAKWVAVEMGGTPLGEFEHPDQAIYVLGNENTGLPQSVMSVCHEVVSLPYERYASYNVAVAGSIVMYDRQQKLARRGDSSKVAAEADSEQGSDRLPDEI